MIIDIHAHLHFQPSTEQCTENLLHIMEVYGIDKAYVSSVDGGYYPTEDIVRRNNAAVAELIRKHPKRFGGAVYANPSNSDTLDVLKRGFEEQGMSLIKLWVSTPADDDRAGKVMEFAEDYGMPVVYHTFLKVERVIPTESTGINISKIAKRYPKTKIIMAHFGGSCYNAIPAIAECKNVWCDYAFSVFGGDAMDYTVEMLGAERILYGSDMPGVSVPVNIGKILSADLSGEQRDMIFYKNSQKLLDRSFRL